MTALVTDISKAGLSEEDMRSYCDKLHTVLCNFSLSECRDPGNKRLLIQVHISSCVDRKCVIHLMIRSFVILNLKIEFIQ